jgi:hypothetical protein
LQVLAVNMQGIIPGYADAALIVVRDGLALAVRISHDGVTGPYRSSLLVGSLPAPASAQLLIRAIGADAFAGLAAELLALGSAAAVRSLLVDLHLDGVSAPESVNLTAGQLVGQSTMNQAVGALLDRGWLPEEAEGELDRIGVQLAVTSAVAAQLFLRTLVNRDGGQPPTPGNDSWNSPRGAASEDSRE